MKLKVRYDNTVQTIDLDAEATEKLWVSLSLEGEGLTQEQREKMIQDEWTVIAGTAKRSLEKMRLKMMSIPPSLS